MSGIYATFDSYKGRYWRSTSATVACTSYGEIFAQLSKNLENATMKARRYSSRPGARSCSSSADFRSAGAEVTFERRTARAQEVHKSAILQGWP